MLWHAAHFLKILAPSAALVEVNMAIIFPDSSASALDSVEETLVTWDTPST